MAKAEIDETELLANRQVVEAMQKMLANPKSRELVLKAQKVVNPDAVIPEIDARAPLESALDEIRKELAKDREDRAKERDEAVAAKKREEFTAGWERQKQALRTQGYTDEGLKKIEEHAEKEGIPSLRAAAADWEKLNPSPPPAQPTGGIPFDIFNPPENDAAELKALMDSRGDDPMALNKLIGKSLAEARGTK